MKVISPKTKLIFNLVAGIKEIRHFGMTHKIKNVTTIIDGECAEYSELFSIDSITSDSAGRTYLLEVVHFLNDEVGETVLEVRDDHVIIKEDYKGKYTFLFTEQHDEFGGYFAEVNTLNKGIKVVE